MIDDAVLERLLTDAAGSIEPPTEGPGRVLDHRQRLVSEDEYASTLRRLTHRPYRLAAVAAALIIVVALVVVSTRGGGGPKPQSNATSGAASPQSTVAGSGTSGGPSGSNTLAPVGIQAPAAASATQSAGSSTAGSGGEAGADGSNPGAGGPVNPSEVPPGGVQAKVIKTAQVALQVPIQGLTPTMTKLSTIAAAQGGYVQSSGTNTAAPGQAANGTVTLRVPVANFANALDQAEALGTDTSVTTSGQDVTSQYVDLQARLQSLQTARTQYEQILSHATTIPDILSVEQQISDLQTQIEQLQGQMNVMTDQTSYATIAVNVSEAPGATPAALPRAPSGISRAWAHARHSFVRGFEGVLAASGGLAVFVIIVAIVALVGRLAWGQYRRRMI